MVLTESWRRDIAQNFGHRLTGGEFVAENFCLSRDRTEARQYKQIDILTHRGASHVRPCRRGERDKKDGLAFVVDADLYKFLLESLAAGVDLMRRREALKVYVTP